MDRTVDNAFEWTEGAERITFTVSSNSKRLRNRIKKLAEQYPLRVDIHENPDGSIYGHLPFEWVRVQTPRKVILTEAQKANLAERLKAVRPRNAK